MKNLLWVALLACACALPPGCSRAPADAADHLNTAASQTCAAHGAPRDRCFICNPALRDKGRLWCREHARYEDRCWDCHPEARDKSRAFCDEHGLYEDECFICHPEATETAADTGEDENRGLVCGGHRVLEAECGICHPDLVGQLQPGQSMKVRLPATGSARIAGVTVGKAETGGLTAGIECLAEIAFDQNKLAQISSPVGGITQSVEVDLGAKVREKQVVARIWSATIAETVAKAVLTHQTLERERKLRAERVTSQRDLQQAEAEHRAACQQARTLGFTEEQIDAFGGEPDEPVLLDVRVPFDGEIIERTAVRGALVEAGKPLFTVADRSQVWAMLSIPEKALAQVRPGQMVELQVESVPDRTFTGRLTWVAAKVDDRTRMASARVELPDPEGALKAHMFARARIITRAPEGALVVPASAVHRIAGQPIVFVQLEDDLFAARAVRLGAKLNGKLEVVEGLDPAEQVVLARGFPLKSQLLSSRLGAGCAHE